MLISGLQSYDIQDLKKEADILFKIESGDRLGWSVIGCPEIYKKRDSDGKWQNFERGFYNYFTFKTVYGLESSKIAIEWTNNFTRNIPSMDKDAIDCLERIKTAFETLTTTYKGVDEKGIDKKAIIINYESAVDLLQKKIVSLQGDEARLISRLKEESVAVEPVVCEKKEEFEVVKREVQLDGSAVKDISEKKDEFLNETELKVIQDKIGEANSKIANIKNKILTIDDELSEISFPTITRKIKKDEYEGILLILKDLNGKLGEFQGGGFAISINRAQYQSTQKRLDEYNRQLRDSVDIAPNGTIAIREVESDIIDPSRLEKDLRLLKEVFDKSEKDIAELNRLIRGIFDLIYDL
ncbi:MAG: hypothetical protein K1000chlam1_01364 [Candidatus Anoxychlamydiales bacterium]|nr:hypothetical protein [Candidatus Anoxychlamydiales bacterium]